MNQIEKQVDSIIVRLKTIEELKPLKFVREYGPHNAEMPVVGLVAVVSVTDTALSKSYIGGYMSSSVKGEQFLQELRLEFMLLQLKTAMVCQRLQANFCRDLKKLTHNRLLLRPTHYQLRLMRI